MRMLSDQRRFDSIRSFSFIPPTTVTTNAGNTLGIRLVQFQSSGTFPESSQAPLASSFMSPECICARELATTVLAFGLQVWGLVRSSGESNFYLGSLSLPEARLIC